MRENQSNVGPDLPDACNELPLQLVDVLVESERISSMEFPGLDDNADLARMRGGEFHPVFISPLNSPGTRPKLARIS